MNISKFNRPFSSNTTLYASQLNGITDAIDYLIDVIGNSQDDPDNPNNPDNPDPVNPDAGKVPAVTITIDDWNALTEKDPNIIYVVVSNDGVTVIGIAISGVLTTIPVPASGQVVTLSQEQYDALNPKIATTLYFIESDGVIVKAYLGDLELTLGSNPEAVVKSKITEMFSQGFTWETVNGQPRLKSINYSKISVDNPGEFYAQTGFEDYVKGTIRDAGFISKTDNTQNFSEMYAAEVGKDSTIAKKASIIAAINESGETGVTINAEKIDLQGYVRADDINTLNLTAKQLLAKGNSDYPRVVINSTDGIQLLTSAQASAININMDGSGSLANGNITWNANGDLVINGTFKVGAKYIEYIYDNSVSATVSFSEAPQGITATITITNSNNFDIYCNAQWYADGTNMAWSASSTTDIIRVGANSSRIIESGMQATDIPGYSSTTHPSVDVSNSGADLVNVYHYIESNNTNAQS